MRGVSLSFLSEDYVFWSILTFESRLKYDALLLEDVLQQFL